MSSPTGSKASRQSPPRERLINAALTLFVEKGFAATSTREIAEKAVVNEVTLFRIFKSKAGLLADVSQQHGEWLWADHIEAGLQKRSFSEGVGYLVTTLFERAKKESVMIRFRLLHDAVKEPSKIRSVITAHFKRGMREGLVDKRIPLEAMAQLLVMLSVGCAFLEPFSGKPLSPVKTAPLVSTFTRILLKGVKP